MAGNRQAASRYTKALFNMAWEQGQLDEVEVNMAGIAKTLEGSSELSQFLDNLLIPAPKRLETLEALFKDRVAKVTYEFILLLEEKKRMSLLPTCCLVFRDLYYDLKGVLRVTATSAHPMSEQQREGLVNRLEVKFSKSIELETQVDPSLIGGFKVQIGDQIFDSSVSTSLELLEQRLIHA